uniref:NTR domain-containing protein n=1 Tax=Strongyloides papillosus TaxID=174720 RepID=A0A0N5C0L2_STREA
MLKVLILCFSLLWCIKFGYSCSCAPITVEESWCQADWISYVQIIKTSYNKMSNQSEIGQDLYGIKYTVKHLETFKKPSKKKLSNIIYTASVSSLCGITDLSKGYKLYLSGFIEKKKRLTINICTSLLFNYDQNGSVLESDIKALKNKSYKTCKKEKKSGVSKRGQNISNIQKKNLTNNK